MNKNEIITDIYNQHIVERAISSSGFAIKETIYDDIVQNYTYLFVNWMKIRYISYIMRINY